MLREIQQVLRLVMILRKQRQQQGVKTAGGLLVLLWPETGAPVQSLNCTVAAAGPWCTGIKMEALQAGPCPEPDPEELCAFTDLHGSLRLLLSFQMKDARLVGPDWQPHIEAFLHTFSLANAGIRIHLKSKFNQQTIQQEFRVNIKSKVARAVQPSLLLDVTSSTQSVVLVVCVDQCCVDYRTQKAHECNQTQLYLHVLMLQKHVGNRAVKWTLGCRTFSLSLSFSFDLKSPGACEDRKLVSGRSSCSWRQVSTKYPTRSHGPRPVRRAERPVCHTSEPLRAAVLVYSPSNVPVTGPSAFFQNLPAHLDCQELGLQGLHCSSFTDLAHSSGIVYTVEQENCEEPQRESSLLPMKQKLLIFLFLQHSDSFISQLSDIMATEALIEHHLEDILNNNSRAVTTALQTELKNTLKAQNHRNKDQEKLRSAVEVILSSSIGIVSCSSNMDFRNACLNSMKVSDTHELSASLRESLRTVTSWKFIPKGRCHTAQMEEHPESDEEPTRTEI
ncbi:DUF4554 domain-containing protein isoform X2 [Thunnus albacares]|uniref:DUF4554 domain-containing protein isoform X2 n=1 Tax=Thunnus albacares TaxID=8236 RepID=UPI001CF69825|nr:DUF4554 domain-containing protein isoform X2 [Thunnus albacares]